MTPTTLQQILADVQGTAPNDLVDATIEHVTIDSREVRTGSLFVALKGSRVDGHDFVASALQAGAAAAIVEHPPAHSSGTPASRIILVDDGVTALGRLGSAQRGRYQGRVVGVTGSNGKTTTKGMIAHVLGTRHTGTAAIKSFNNQLGVPLTLLAAGADDDFIVAELGTSAPGEIAQLAAMVRPHVAVVTSIGQAHLAGLGDLGGVAREKLSVLGALARDGVAVLPFGIPDGDPGLEAAVQNAVRAHPDARVWTFGSHARFPTGAVQHLHAVDLSTHRNGLTFTVQYAATGASAAVQLAALGRHNVTNALAAVAVGLQFDMALEDIAQALSTWRPTAMRLTARRHGAMCVINDAYNANPTSMRAALAALHDYPAPGRRVAVLGDMRELGPAAEALHRDIGAAACHFGIDVLIGVGEHGAALCEEAARTAPAGVRAAATHTPTPPRDIETHALASVEALQHRIGAWLEPDDTVLLKASRAMRLERLLDRGLPPAQDEESPQGAVPLL